MDQQLLAKIIQDNDEQADSMNRHFYNKRCPSTQPVLDLLGITETDSKNVKVFDEQEGLELYHYIDYKNENTNHIRGTIISDGKIVCRSMPFVAEISLSTFKTFNLPDQLINNCVISESHEGTAVRFFYHNDKWIMSTHKNIDGGNRRWNSDNFQTLFNEIIKQDELEKLLDTKYCYNFLINHPRNSLVCTYTTPKLYLLGVYEGNKKVDVTIPNIETLKNISVTSTLEFIDLVDKSDWTTLNGFYVSFPSNDRERMIKVVHDQYFVRKQLFGNQANRAIRYLDLKKLGVTYDIMKHFDTKNSKMFTDIENNISNLKKELWRIFRERYFNNNYENTSTEKHILIKTLKDNNQSLIKKKDEKALKTILDKTVDEYQSWYLLKMLK